MISFTVVGVPLAWPRAQCTAHIMRIGGKLRAIAKMFVPEDDDIKKFKHDIAFEARQARHKAWPDWQDAPLIESPVGMTITFVFPRTSRITWVRKPMLRQWYVDVPDIDNLVKAVLDSLNKVIYNDDRQVCKLNVIKIFASGDEPPAVHIVLSELPPYTEETNEQTDSPAVGELQEDQRR